MLFKFITPEQNEPASTPANSARLKWLVAGAILLVTGVLVGGATWAALATPAGRAEAAVLAAATPPSTNWQWQNPLPQGNDLSAVTCVTQDECYAVGSGGSIISIQPQTGGDWKLQNSGVYTPLTAVSCTASGNCLAAGAGKMLRTTNSGQTWATLSTNLTATLNYLTCLSDGSNTCYATDNNHVFKTTDAGSSWVSTYYSTSNSMNSRINGITCFDASNCYLVQNSNFIKTSDGGANWNSQPVVTPTNTYYTENFYDLSCPTPQVCYTTHSPHGARLGGVEAAYYRLAKTTDGGLSWTTMYSTTAASTNGFSNITCPDVNTCYAPTQTSYGVPYLMGKTIDGGTTWSQQNFMTGHSGFSYLNGISSFIPKPICLSSVLCYALGYYGDVYKTTDGEHWQSQLKGVFAYLTEVKCADTLNCYITAYQEFTTTNGSYTNTAFLVTTNNGGQTWISQTQGTLTGIYFNSLSCPAINTCFADGPSYVYKTVDGGQSWITLTNGITSTNPATIRCPSQQICYTTVYTDRVIFATSDGGTSWISQAFTGTNITAMDCPTLKVCYAGGGTAIYKTSDGGQNWHYQAYITGTVLPSVENISCPTDQVCYTTPHGGAFCKISTNPSPDCEDAYKTTDGGQTWITINPSAYLGGPISCPSVSICYTASKYTTDGGITWTPTWGATLLDCPLSCTETDYNAEIISNFDPQQLNSLELSGPSRVTVGQPVSFTLRAKTASNSVASSYTGTVHFGSSDSQGVIPADYSYTAADGGSHVFTVTFNTLGSQSLGVNDTFYTRLLKTSALVNVVPPCNPYTVTASSDDGGATDCGTLSYALSQAGIATSPVTITFASPVITLTSPLTTITPTVAVRIEGSCNLSGTLGLPGTRLVAGSSSVSTAITLTSGMTMNGVGISGFSGYGVVVAGANNTLTCNQIGPAGSYAGNGGGIKLVGSGNRLGLDGVPGSGNLIGGNQQAGILVTNGSQGNRTVYNRVGFALDGLTKAANGRALLVQRGGQLLVGPGNRFQS